jgi:hypothetical protein
MHQIHRPMPPMRIGLGQASSGMQAAINTATAGASVTVGILSALSAAAIGSSLVPGIGTAIAGAIALSVAIYKMVQGCGQTCIEASDLANQAEALLLQNLQNYMNAPVHYASLQAAALNNFQTVWASLQQACGNPNLSTAGMNCLKDRQAGACHYTTSPGGWQGDTYVNPGAQGSGSACWNWFVGYHDPIAYDPTVQPDPVPGTTGASSILTSSTTSSMLPLFLGIAAIIALVMVIE